MDYTLALPPRCKRTADLWKGLLTACTEFTPETLTTATASSRPREPQLTMRASTPRRHTLREGKRQTGLADVRAPILIP